MMRPVATKMMRSVATKMRRSVTIKRMKWRQTFRFVDRKGPFHICQPLLSWQVDLRRRVTDALQEAQDRRTEVDRQFVRLIKTPPKFTPRMERNGDDAIGVA